MKIDLLLNSDFRGWYMMYSWSDVLANDKRAAKIASEAGITISNLDKLSDVQFFEKKPGFSDGLYKFLIFNIPMKFSEIKNMLEEELPETTMKTPKDLFDYDSQVYKNRNIGGSNKVYIRGEELLLPSKELLNVNKPDIKIIRWGYETDHLRSSDHMDGDYGCTGYFSSLRGYIQNKEVFQSTSVCSCHKRGHPNLEFNVVDKYVSAANAQTIDFVNDSLDAFRNKIEPGYNAHLKEERIQEIEEKLQMSRKDLKGLLG